MQTYEIIVRNRSLTANSSDMSLVRTSAGIDRVHLLFCDAEWLDFPVTITFGHGDALVSETLVISGISDSSGFIAEAYVDVPSEVTSSLGTIRVTLQGTDSQGRHIITAAGSPLSVEEAGDVEYGEQPEGSPTVDQWQQAYADAMVAVGQAATLVENLGRQLESMVDDARTSLDGIVQEGVPIATRDTLGTIIVGNGLEIAESGELYVSAARGITDSQVAQITNLAALAYYCFDTEFDSNGELKNNAKVKSSAVPVATVARAGSVIPDGTTIMVDTDGMIHSVGGVGHRWDGTVLTITSEAGTSSTDLAGPFTEISDVTAIVDDTSGTPSVTVDVGGTPGQRTFAFSFSGLKGERGERGPSGYTLTNDDIEAISDEILSRYSLADEVSY